jgi:LysM repeat protein
MKKLLMPLFSALIFATAGAQQRAEIQAYIDKYKQVAIDEMVRAKIPASITIAQGILESSAGTSVLSRKSNNHFGIKCKEDWTGGKYYHDDDRPQECFRVYSSVNESYADHSDFLVTRPRYAPLFQLPVTSYKYWAFGLKEAGYATNPKYATMLIGYIEDYKLFELDQTGVALIEEKAKVIAKTSEPQPLEAEVSSKVVVTDVKPEVKTHESHPVTVIESKTSGISREEFTVNGLRALKAQANEDPFKAAYEYNIDYSSVMSYNDMVTGDRFREGQYIFLQPKKSRGAESTYTVLAGENMHDIAQKTGVKVYDLYNKNAMKMNDQPRTGEVLNLQARRSAPPQTMTYAEYLKAQSKTSNGVELGMNELSKQRMITNAGEYQVQKSDTLYSIARKFNTSVEELKQINKLETSELQPGQTLVVGQ